MEKRKRAVSLSFLLIRFLAINGVLVVSILVLWFFFGIILVQSTGWVLSADYAAGQVSQFISEQDDKDSFIAGEAPSLADYALLDTDGQVLETNASGNTLDKMVAQYQNSNSNVTGYYAQYTYSDGTTVVLRYRYVADFANENLRRILPPYEYLSHGILAALVIGCLLITTMLLRRKLIKNLSLFGEVSRKVAQQDLDFTVPKAEIKEFDAVMATMDEMRVALKQSLFTQWTAEQQRQGEISALAHDLKTPLTIISGNAELLLEDVLLPEQEQMVKTIGSNTDRAKRYVSSMLSATAGSDEPFEAIQLWLFMEEVFLRAEETTSKSDIDIQVSGELTGYVNIQFERLCRAVTNIIQNAIEHTPVGGSIRILFKSKKNDTWTIRVEDGGSGFSRKALKHATQRLWREDSARGGDVHSGLGLWFANEVIVAHGGMLCLTNGEHGGIVEVKIPYAENLDQQKYRNKKPNII